MSLTIIELNVGGVFYATSLSTLTKNPDSKLGRMFGSTEFSISKDSKGKYFIDRDGVLFRYVLDYLRNDALTLPENFGEIKRLTTEAEYYELPGMIESIKEVEIFADNTSKTNHHTPPENQGTIIIGYRGTFGFGKDGLADVKFRKLSKILVHGKVNLCREVFGDTLNESRDPDRGGSNRYSCRFFLKHTSLEMAFDALIEVGFRLITSCGSGTSSASSELRPGVNPEENRWNHYNEFVFVRL